MKKITLFIFLLTAFFGYAQEKKIERATKRFNQYDYVNSQEIYQKVVDKGYESGDLFKRLADSYYLNAKYDEAATYYGKLIEQFPEDVEPEVYFRYATSLRATKDYALSDKMMARFYDLGEDDTRAVLFRKAPDYLREIEKQKGAYDVSITQINSGYSDFGSALYKDKLIFASNRDTGGYTKRVHKWNGQPFLNLYQVDTSKVGQDGGTKFAKPFSANLNTQYHESSPVFAKGDSVMYFTRNNYSNGIFSKDSTGTNKLKLYRASYRNGAWGGVKELPFNSDNYTVAHPALSPDGKKLYFSSDMPGTLGQADLWYVAINEDGTYGEPVNLGNRINTEGRESFPYVSAANDLFFASNGHPGLGGLDIFLTNLDATGEDVTILNIGEPANTSKDDFAFIIDSDTKTGFLSSNRGKSGIDDDIYMIRELRRPEPLCEILLTGNVTDKNTEELLKGATVALYDDKSNLIESIVTGRKATFEFEPECDAKYLLRGSKDGYTTVEKRVSTPNLSGEIQEFLQLERAVQIAKPGDDIAKILNLNPIYFDFDKYYIRPDAEIELAKVLVYMETYPSVRIDVRSHTDSRGNDEYNRTLSQNRNVSTRDWLIAKGINPSRLSGRGYGESQLVNECSNGVQCSEEQHQLNRRSEFIVLSNN